MNVEQEITRVAERYIDLINSYPEESQRLVPCDHIDSKEIVIEIRAFPSLADNIYRQLPSKDGHRNLTIILHSDGEPSFVRSLLPSLLLIKFHRSNTISRGNRKENRMRNEAGVKSLEFGKSRAVFLQRVCWLLHLQSSGGWTRCRIVLVSTREFLEPWHDSRKDSSTCLARRKSCAMDTSWDKRVYMHTKEDVWLGYRLLFSRSVSNMRDAVREISIVSL